VQGSIVKISDPGFLKRLISGAKSTGLKGVRAALPCFTKAKTQMKLHPNEFVRSILKDLRPWTVVLKNGTVFYVLNGYYHVLPK
jgi:hypothetical protein